MASKDISGENDYGATLRIALMERKMSQADLARKSGCSESTVSRFGHNPGFNIPIKDLISIAKALDVSVDYLLGLTVVPKVRTSDDEFCYVLYQCYARASTRDQQLVGVILNDYLTDGEHAMNYDLR